MSHMPSSPAPSEKRRHKAARRAGEFPPAPDPLAVPVFDSHTHLDLTIQEAGVPGGPSADPVQALIEAAAKNGVDRLVQVGVDVDSSQWGADLADRHDAVLAAVALHPNEAPRLTDLDEALRRIDDLAARPRVRGIGETGMDTFRTGDDGRAAQETSFRAHIAIAKRHGKALIIHDREAHTDVLRILDDEGAPDTVVMHCFSGDAAFATACVRRGFHLSFAGTITFASAGNLREAAAVTPPELMMVETDAPYLTPAPHRGRPNASYLIPLTVRALAAARGIDTDTLCATISATGDRVFGPWRRPAGPPA
ncbi:AraC family transcriptional regulator [Actinoplanes sp. SE50]|uniref:TatD family hydrolase n=1 Tax=unclassified Actinoplanes TaxID=2626549 RepID=UPI00023EDDFE|nr:MULTISPECIES: TatD family hydrolase [unclassified Actinoplanes]AEV88676.1 TatD DNase family protein [Actinoplanes sp. SE50/110]ATO87080.1 AraC family transcriptional regulator [Actinoplanes sp. SE50]SLM04498.1 AraC family transcriptional regulator [Actinoplanes sp. SE50/110]